MALEKLEDYIDKEIGFAVIKVLGEKSNLTKKALIKMVLNLVEKYEVGEGRIASVVSKLEGEEIKVEKRRGSVGYKYSLNSYGHEIDIKSSKSNL